MGNLILVVEDDKAIREAMQQSLVFLGYHVSVVSNGQEALDFLRSQERRPCLIYLDITMPVMDGWEFRVQQQQDAALADIPVVVVTADGNASAKAQKMNVQEGLRKPLDFDVLLETTRKYCSH